MRVVGLGARAALRDAMAPGQISAAALWLVAAATIAAAGRAAGAAQADRVSVCGGLFGLLIPLSSYLLASRLSPRGPLLRTHAWIMEWGGSRRHFALGMTLGAALRHFIVTATVTLSLWVLSGAVRSGAGTALGTLGLALQAAATYLLLFSGAEWLAPSGRLSPILLLGNWTLGALGGRAALLGPLAQLEALLSGVAPTHFPFGMWGVVALLWLSALVVFGVGIQRTRP